MNWNELKSQISRLDLQVKVVIVLVVVIAPIYALVSLAVSQITIPVIEEELRMVGIHAGSALSEEIQSNRLLSPGREEDLEYRLRQTFFIQPNVVQVDAFRKNELGDLEVVASTEDLINISSPEKGFLPQAAISSRKVSGESEEFWEVWVPIKNKKINGAIRLEVSLQSAASLVHAVWKILVIAGAANILVLLVALSYFLRKTIINDRKLRQAETHNFTLTEQLHEAERQLMIQEKLAVMGQLTASFAHEIGTPLNAVSGHLQLLQEDLNGLPNSSSFHHRMQIVGDQLTKIENIVKGFLQSTAKPTSQFQLTDLNQVLEKTLGIVRPRIDILGVRLEKTLDQKLGPVRAVPLDIEQVFLNLLKNSLDSLQAKKKEQPSANPRLEIFSRRKKDGLKEWIELGVFDSGEGISRKDIAQVFKPFYTTKAAGEGTGLGLTICQEIAGKYDGKLDVESKEGMWTRVTLRIPYGVNP